MREHKEIEKTTPIHARLTAKTKEHLEQLSENYGIDKTSIISMLINKEYNAQITEDAIWALKIQLAEKEGYLSNEESENYIKSVLNAKD